MDAAEEVQRTAVVARARKWLGTPFRDQTDIIGVGVDCAMLLVRCFVDTGVLAPFDPRPYSPQWHLHQRAEKYLEWLRGFADETDEMRPGNVAVYKFGLCYSHGGIVLDPQNMISAYLQHRIASIQELWAPGYVDRPRLIFDVWAKRRDRG